jgi:hypothetical protein
MPEKPDELFEAALRAWPLAETPHGFSHSVLERIKPPRPHAQLKFRLTWLDYALGLFLSLLPAVGFVSWAFLPRDFFMRLQFQWLLLNSPAFAPVLTASLAAMLVLAALILIVGIQFLIRPQRFSL